MKIGELEQHCGNCSLIGLCAAPYEDLCICGSVNLEDMTEEEYLEKAQKHGGSNEEIFEAIVKEKGGAE